MPKIYDYLLRVTSHFRGAIPVSSHHGRTRGAARLACLLVPPLSHSFFPFPALTSVSLTGPQEYTVDCLGSWKSTVTGWFALITQEHSSAKPQPVLRSWIINICTNALWVTTQPPPVELFLLICLFTSGLFSPFWKLQFLRGNVDSVGTP